jgi:hypothetical protein
LIAKIHRQDAASISAPPASGPITVDTPLHAVHVPIARPRSDSGNTATIVASPLGTSIAPATPWSARATIRNVASGAIAQKNDVTPNIAVPSANTRRRPNRSLSEPPIRISDDSVSRYASTIHCCSASPASRSLRIAGSATLTTVLSMKTIAEPRMHATSVSRFWRALMPATRY